MKRILIALICLATAVAVVPGCLGERHASANPEALKDGVYAAATAPDGERYYCRGTMTVEKGKIVSIEWEIRDQNRNDRIFDESYGPEVYRENELYRYQCRENLQGMKSYGPRLVETQDLARVDAITGATWAHGQFARLSRALLKKARE